MTWADSFQLQQLHVCFAARYDSRLNECNYARNINLAWMVQRCIGLVLRIEASKTRVRAEWIQGLIDRLIDPNTFWFQLDQLLSFAVTRVLMKIFRTRSRDVTDQCQMMFGMLPVEHCVSEKS